MLSPAIAARVEIEKRKRLGVYGGAPSLLAWMKKARPFLAPDRPFDLTRHKYLRDIYGDDCQEQVIQKAAQMGASEYLVSYGLWSADERGANCIYVFPTDKHISDFSSARFGPATEPLVSPLPGRYRHRGAGQRERKGGAGR